MTTFELLVREPGQAGRHVTVEGTLDAGREVEGLLLADAQTSRRHLRFTVDGAVLSVTDQGSTNGTTVNGSRIDRPTPVADGDTIEVGDTVIVVASHSVAVDGAVARAIPSRTAAHRARRARHHLRHRHRHLRAPTPLRPPATISAARPRPP